MNKSSSKWTTETFEKEGVLAIVRLFDGSLRLVGVRSIHYYDDQPMELRCFDNTKNYKHKFYEEPWQKITLEDFMRQGVDE